MILVADSSALITLSRIDNLDLLQRLAGTIHVPEAVYREVVSTGATRSGGRSVEQAEWIIRHEITDRLAVERLSAVLGHGEAEAIVLAGELRADLVILDDATARRVAEAEGREVIGLLGLLIHAKNRGLLSAVRPTLDRIVSVGFYLDDRLYRTVLRAAGEEI